MLGRKRWQAIAKLIVTLAAILVTVSWGSTGDAAQAAFWDRSRTAALSQTTVKKAGKIAEASPPIVLQELRQALDDYQPQVTILSPRKNDVLSDTSVSVRFLVKDLPLFKDETFGLGPHLHVLLDNRPYQAVYDASQPLVFDNLEPGTHTIRAFASRPWHESFKNDGAFAQTTFHVLTKTQDNYPDPELPLLTYSRPQGTYGAEPILLDFYLTNAPLHLVAQADATDDIADWRIRCTVNGDSFVIDRWQPLYLKGFKPGKNWVQLEYLDDKGNPVANVFNNTVRLVEYQPNGDDTLSKIIRGELTVADVRGIVDPDYVPPAPEPTPEPSLEPNPEPSPASPFVEPTPEPSPESVPESHSETPTPLETPQAAPTPAVEPPDRPIAIPPPSIVRPEPSPTPSPQPSPSPSASETVIPAAPETPAAAPSLPAAPIVVEPQPSTSKVEPVLPDVTTPTSEKAVSGQERLRQLGQKLGQYRSQQRQSTKPSRAMPSTDRDRPSSMPNAETNPIPKVSIPDSLPPTLPEIIDTIPLAVPTSSAPAPAAIEEPDAH